MTRKKQTFKAADISQRFKAACIEFDNLLASVNSSELVQIRHKLRDNLKEHKQRDALTVAFIGQYSAGKSTIISALTGRRDIYIDTDIATDKTTLYEWNGINVIDTPGLFTDRQDHDEITYRAIAKADLLVFCLTHMLFDNITAENFKTLAYDKGYRWKIMLVVNKMSAAAGEEKQKIASYRHSLAEALKPHALDEFPICFIDAKDYCDGVDEEDDFLLEASRFNTFITELNRFVARRASLARLDTPIRLILGHVDDAQISFARNSNEDTAFLEVLSRLSRRIAKQREWLRTQIKGITLEVTAAINTEGTHLASAVGEASFENVLKQAEIKVRRHYKEAGEKYKDKATIARQSIQLEVMTELQSDLAQVFMTQFGFDDRILAQEPTGNPKRQQAQEQVAWLQKIGDQVGAKITASATKDLTNVSQGFLRSMEVAGSPLHQGVYNIGKFIGFDFKPWQAVGIAKNIGNAAMFLGPAAALVSIAMETRGIQKDQEREQKMAQARRGITSQFKAIAIDLEQQMEDQLRQFESQIYGQLEQNIAAARQQTEAAMAASHSELGQLATIRQNLEAILREIQQVAPRDAF